MNWPLARWMRTSCFASFQLIYRQIHGVSPFSHTFGGRKNTASIRVFCSVHSDCAGTFYEKFFLEIRFISEMILFRNIGCFEAIFSEKSNLFLAQMGFIKWTDFVGITKTLWTVFLGYVLPLFSLFFDSFKKNLFRRLCSYVHLNRFISVSSNWSWNK